jgi:hypothetical protein
MLQYDLAERRLERERTATVGILCQMHELCPVRPILAPPRPHHQLGSEMVV